MLCGERINYFELSYYFYNNVSKDNYIKIGTDEFYTNSIDTFSSFEFKLNKRGGESGTIKFVKMFADYKIGDTVECKINGKKIFRGVIEKIEDYGLTIKAIPLWGKLGFVYVTDSLELEETKNIYDYIIGLADKIREAGIKFNPKLIEVPANQNMVKYEITTSMAGKSILELLEEVEEELPTSYNFGVNEGGTFYFKQFSETKEKTLNWHSGDFSNNEIDEDYSELYSRYVVKHKRYSATGESEDAYDVLKWIVGGENKKKADGTIEYNPYPPIAKLTQLVGIKTKVFEYNFQSDEEEAYNYAYDLLKRQEPIISLNIEDLNYLKKDINVNECVEVILRPIENYYTDFNLSYSTKYTITNNMRSGDIVKIGYIVGYARDSNEFMGILDFTKLYNYTEVCNRVLDIYEIRCNYYSSRSQDKFYITDNTGRTKVVYGGGGRLKANVKGFNKRSLKIIADNSNVVFFGMRGHYTQGSAKLLLNVREIEYSYEKGITSVNLKLAEMKTVLTGYMHAQNKRLKALENLLSN